MELKKYIIFSCIMLILLSCNAINASSNHTIDDATPIKSQNQISIQNNDEILKDDDSISLYGNETNDETDNKTLQENITYKTFTELSSLINETEMDSILIINESYKYYSSVDSLLINGVVISKNLTIIGQNNCFIDGSFIARCLSIEENCRVTLKDMTLMNGYIKDLNGGAILAGKNSNISIENHFKFLNY